MPLFRPPAAEEKPDRFAERLAHLRERLGLAAVMKPLGERPAEIAAAQATLARLRAEGWRWFAALEGQLAGLKGRAHEQLHQAEGRRATLVAPVRVELDALEEKGRSADAAARAALDRALDPLDDELVTAERALERALAGWTGEVERALTAVRRGEDTLAAYESAGFRLPPDERPLLALGAAWVEGGDEAPGQLLLSDRRLRFERRDDRVARRNRAGLAVETHTDRTLLLDEPYAALAAAKGESAGLLVREARVTLSWKDGRSSALVLERSSPGEIVDWLDDLRAGGLARFA